MGKDQELMQAVRDQDYPTAQKLLVKHRTTKSKLIGSGKRLNVNQQDSDGMSALHQAALIGNVELMKLLLNHEALVDLKDTKGMRALHYASWQGKDSPVALLLQHGSSVNEPAHDGNTPLHLACEHGHYNVVEELLNLGGNPGVENNKQRSPLDAACEFGRCLVVELLLKNELCRRTLLDYSRDQLDNDRTTCLHLAAKNGHTEIVRLLIQAGVDINRQTLQGTCLHEAAMCGKVDVVRFLLSHGADVNRLNSYELTPLEIVNRFTATRAAKELKQILKEAEGSLGVRARAIRDYSNNHDGSYCSFKEGDIITVVEQHPTSGLWKGYRYNSDGYVTRPGYFPSSAVVLIDPQVSCSVSRPRSASSQGSGHSGHSTTSPLSTRVDLTHYGGTVGADSSFPLPPSPLVKSKMATAMADTSSNDSGISPQQSAIGAFPSGRHHHNSGGLIVHQHDRAVGIVHVGEGGELGHVVGGAGKVDKSPTGSNRSSTSSSGSGGYQNGAPIANGGRIYRLSGQSCESGVSGVRVSYHSASGSSQDSIERLEESGYSSTVNVHEMLEHGLSDSEVLHTWLAELHLDDLAHLFLQAGYDMPTISRMTPEDLVAIGISKPSIRKKLKTEIGKLSISDGIPDFKPKDLGEWLRMLRLDEYYETLVRQNYSDINNITDITWEDLEEIGIKRLGHQKKIMLAIDKLKRLNGSMRRLSSSGRTASVEVLPVPTSCTPSSPFQSAPYPVTPKQNNIQNFAGFNQGQSVTTKHYDVPSSARIGIGEIPNARFPMVGNNAGFSSTSSCPSPSPSSATDGSSRSVTPIQVQVQIQPKPLPSLFRQTDFASIGQHKFGSGVTGAMSGGSQPVRGPLVATHGRSSESDGDMTPTNERKGSPAGFSGGQNDVTALRPLATVSPSPKPKPVAKIIAKTNRLNTRDIPMDIHDMSYCNGGSAFVGTNESKSSGYSYNYSTLPRKFSTKRKMADGQYAPGYDWADDDCFMTTRQLDNQGNVCNDLGRETAITNVDAFGSPLSTASCNGVRSWKEAPVPPKRTNSFKTNLQTVYASVIDRTLLLDNKNLLTNGVGSSDQSPKFPIPGEHRSHLARTESDRLPCRPSDRFNQNSAAIPTNQMDFSSADSLLGAAFRSLEQHAVAECERLVSASDSQIGGHTSLNGRMSGSDGFPDRTAIGVGLTQGGMAMKGAEARLAGLGMAATRGGGPKLGDWQDNRGDGSSDDSDSGLERGCGGGSNVSLESAGSGGSACTMIDTNTLPFANENVGTIKQRSMSSKPSILTGNGNELNADLFTDNMGTLKLNHKKTGLASTLTAVNIPDHSINDNRNFGDISDNGNNPYGAGNSDNVFNDIDGMLLGLTQELDAMLKLQS